MSEKVAWQDTAREDCWDGYAMSKRLSKSGKALQVVTRDWNNEPITVWIPLAAIHDDSEVWEPHQDGQLVIPLSLAEEKRLAPL